MTHGDIIYPIGKMKLAILVICVIACCVRMKEGDDLSEVSERNRIEKCVYNHCSPNKFI